MTDATTSSAPIIETIHGCVYCGLEHGRLCPSLRAIEYFESGAVKRVEYIRPVDCMPIVAQAPANFGAGR